LLFSDGDYQNLAATPCQLVCVKSVVTTCFCCIAWCCLQALVDIVLFAAGVSLAGDGGLYSLYEAATCPFHLLRRMIFMLDK